MLTDYHVHLRPDELDQTAAGAFTAANAERYRTVAQERGIEELGVAEHVYRFTAALDVWQHPLWVDTATTTSMATARSSARRPTCGWASRRTSSPGARSGCARCSRSASGTTSSARSTSSPRARWTTRSTTSGTAARSPDHVWRTYFTWLGEAAASGMFDILAHPDLVKHWGKEPVPDATCASTTTRHGADRRQRVAVEVSTAGLRKPVGEIYPSPAFLEMLVDAGVPIALSSDAHAPDHLGYRYEEASAPRRPRRDRPGRVQRPRAPDGADRMSRAAASAGTPTASRTAGRSSSAACEIEHTAGPPGTPTATS